MATTYKVLGQTSPAADTDTDLYAVPANTQAVVSSIVICNRAAANNTFRIAIRPANTALANQHYISYDTDVPARDTISLSLGISLGNTDVITVRSQATNNISYSAFGAEIS
jgi:hypothetical protein